MESTYTQFLASPNSSLLAADATLHYVTTTTTIRGATEIMKHLTTLRNQIKKSGEEVLEVIGGNSNVIAAQIKTSITFVGSGGPYLPGLDDNFLADREVRFPIMHIVSFDGEGKIAQIRQSWDQGALLKQIEVIGRSGRNWPIFASDEQIRIITTCVKAVADAGVKTPAAADNRGRGNSANAFGDPHSSLELFTSRVDRNKPDRVVSPYGGTRPRERSIHQILGEESEDESFGSPVVARNQSPSKSIAKAGAGKNYPNRLFREDHEEIEPSGRGRQGSAAAKIGAGKNFPPSRLFDSDQPIREDSPPPSKMKVDRFVRPHPSKYDHFDMADADNNAKTRPGADRSRSRSKHDSSGNFDGFSTPHKALPSRSIRPQDARQWDPEAAAAETAAYKPMGQGRRDAGAQFDLADDGPAPMNPRQTGLPRGSKHNTGLGLYENNLYREDGSAPTPGPDADALGNITNLKDRRKHFDSHWDMKDESEGESAPQPHKVGGDRKKMPEPGWAATDDSPVSKNENFRTSGVPGGKPPNKGINIAGDGMGSRRAHDAGGPAGKKIHIAGDGMGGKKGADRGWLYHDED